MLQPPEVVPVDIFMRTHGARILDQEDENKHESRRDGHDIYLPNHVEHVSHIAVDVGGSLAKVVYFTCAPTTPSCETSPDATPAASARAQESGILEQESQKPTQATSAVYDSLSFHPTSLRGRCLPEQFPGGRLNFTKFESSNMDACMAFLRQLIERSALANNVTVEEVRQSVKIMATGGGAHLFYQRFKDELGVEVQREGEMECLITGLNFMTLIPEEVYWFSDTLVDDMDLSFPKNAAQLPRGDSSLLPNADADLPRPSPSPPLYAPMFESTPKPKLPCLLVNIGSGVSILKIDEFGQFERVSGTSLGGGTLWGLLGLLTDAQNFDEMLELCARGDNSHVDMLVGDIYGPVGLDHLGLKASTIASSFGKVFRWDRRSASPDTTDEAPRTASERRRARFRQEDICRSLLYAISNNIGQIAHMNAEKYKLDRIYFGGCFIRGHQATIATLSYAIRFWSRGRRRAYFLRHEGYLGAIGAWVRQIGSSPSVPHHIQVSEQAPQQHAGHVQRESGPEQKVPLASQPSQLSTSSSSPPSISTCHSHSHSIPAMLAEALGRTTLDGPSTSGDQTSKEGVDGNDGAEVAPAVATATSEPPSDTLTGLLDELEVLDKQGVSSDPDSIHRIMEQLDRAHQVADAIESRVDQLLGKIHTLLPSEAS